MDTTIGMYGQVYQQSHPVRSKIRAYLIALLCVFAKPLFAEDLTQLEESEKRLKVAQFVISGGGDFLNQKINTKTLTEIAHLERKKYPESISIDELHQISDQLTLYVRSRGFSFHSVFLLPQKVENETVSFRYSAAYLTDIHVINNSTIKNQVIEDLFKPFLNKELYTPDLEHLTYALKTKNNIKVFPFFSRAGKNGEIRLNVKVDPVKQDHFSLHADNFGSEVSGKHRLIANLRLQGLSSSFDSLNLSLLHSLDSEKTLHGFLQYHRPFNSLNTDLTLSMGDSSYDIGKNFSTLEMSGTSRTYKAALSRTFNHNPKRLIKGHIAGYQKNSRLDSQFSETLNSEESSTAAELGLSSRWVMNQFSFSAGGTLVGGDYTESKMHDESTNFKKLHYFSSASVLIAGQSRWALTPTFHLRGQHSDALLPGLESSSMSGNYGVRAFPVGAYSGDSAYVSSLSVYMANLAKNTLWQISPYIFYDFAKGTNYYPDSKEIETNLSGYGMGLSIANRYFSVRASYASPLDAKVDGLAIEGEDQWLFELRWH